MENNDQEIREIRNNIGIVNQGNDGTWMAGQNLIGHMLHAEQNRQNLADILNSQKLRSEFIEAILIPKQRLGNKSVLQTYLESDNIQPPDKYTAKQALMRTLFLSEPGLLQKYLDNDNIESQNKQQCLNVLANNSTIIEDYLTYSINPRCKVSFIGALFKPREELDGQSYFDRIENQQSIKNALLLNREVFNAYLKDARMSPQSKQQYLNKLAGNVGEHGAIEKYLADNGVIEILFEPQDGLNGQSYFDGIENKQSIVSGLMLGANQSSLNRYLYLNYTTYWEIFDFNRRQRTAENRQRCLNKLAGNVGEHGAIEDYLLNPKNESKKKLN